MSQLDRIAVIVRERPMNPSRKALLAWQKTKATAQPKLVKP